MSILENENIIMFCQDDITCYILRGYNGDLLIDTGFIKSGRKLEKWISSYDVKYIFLTHAHVDHDWNAARIKKITNAKIILSERDKSLMQNFSSQPPLPTAPKYRIRNTIQKIGGAFMKSKPYEPDFYINENNLNLLKQLGFDADIIPLPGHTNGSIGILCGCTLYCGDAFTAIFHKPDISPHAVNIELMNCSLRKILEINPMLIAPGHGEPVTMAAAKPVIEQYLLSFSAAE